MGRIAIVNQKQGWQDVYYTHDAFKIEAEGRNPEQYGLTFDNETLLNKDWQTVHLVDGIVGKFIVSAEQQIFVGFRQFVDRGLFPLKEQQGLLGFQTRALDTWKPYSVDAINEARKESTLLSIEDIKKPPAVDTTPKTDVPESVDAGDAGAGAGGGSSLGVSESAAATIGFGIVSEAVLEPRVVAAPSAAASGAKKSDEDIAREGFQNACTAMRGAYKHLRYESDRLMHLDPDAIGVLTKAVEKYAKSCAKLHMSAEVKIYNESVQAEIPLLKSAPPCFTKFKPWQSKPHDNQKGNFRKLMDNIVQRPQLHSNLGWDGTSVYRSMKAVDAIAATEIDLADVTIFSAPDLRNKQPYNLWPQEDL